MFNCRAKSFCVLALVLVLPCSCLTGSEGKIRLRLVTTIATGTLPYSIALTPDGSELYVALGFENAVSVIDTRAKRETNRLDACKAPWVVKVSPDGSKAFAGCNGGIAIISTLTKSVTRLNCPGRVRDLAVTRDSRTLFIAGERAGLLSMDVPTHAVKVVDSAVAPVALALTPDGKFLYVNYQSGEPGGRYGHDALLRFDVASGSRLSVITGLANVGGAMAISPDGHRLWANATDACMSRSYDHAGCTIVPAALIRVLELPTHTVLKELFWVRTAVPLQLVFSADGAHVAVNGVGPLLFDASRLEVIASLPQVQSTDCVFKPNGKHAYVALQTNAIGLFEIAPDVQSRPK